MIPKGQHKEVHDLYKSGLINNEQYHKLVWAIQDKCKHETTHNMELMGANINVCDECGEYLNLYGDAGPSFVMPCPVASEEYVEWVQKQYKDKLEYKDEVYLEWMRKIND